MCSKKPTTQALDQLTHKALHHWLISGYSHHIAYIFSSSISTPTLTPTSAALYVHPFPGFAQARTQSGRSNSSSCTRPPIKRKCPGYKFAFLYRPAQRFDPGILKMPPDQTFENLLMKTPGFAECNDHALNQPHFT